MLIQIQDTIEFGGVTFGQTDTFGVEQYFLALDGWGAPQSTVQITQKAAGDGGFASPAYLTARHFTATVALVAPSRPELVAAIDRACGAGGLQLQPVTVSNGGAVRYALAQREGEITVKETSDISVELTFQFVAADPRKFSSALTTSTGLPSSTGGLTIPFTIPFSIDSTVVTGQCSLTNPGSESGRTVLRIESGAGGSVTGPSVTHSPSGNVLALDRSYTLPAGNWLTIDMDARTVMENDQADRSTFVISRGFSGFEAGINTWTFAAAASTGTPLLTVTGSPAWP